MTLAVEDICNQALRQIKYDTPIGWIYEGSRASRVAVEIYSQTRDNLLSDQDWDFARTQVSLILSKTAPVGGYGATPWSPVYPPVPWIYEYLYPATENGYAVQAVQVRSVRPTPIFIPEYDPKFWRFVTANDTASQAKVILTDLANAQAVITQQLTDPAQWIDNRFVEALVDALALKFQQAFDGQPDLVKVRAAEEGQAEQIGAVRRG
jgi:hypothetical protein